MYLNRNVIGRTYYYFLDEDRYWHGHGNNPADSSSPWYAWWLEHRDTIPVFQLRHGGWFRENRIIRGPGKGWYVSSWDGLIDVRLSEREGCFSCHPGWGSLLHHIVTKFDSFKDLWESADADQALQQKFGITTKVRDHLGRGIARVPAMMAVLRETMGRSQHAQKIREHFVEVFLTIPLDEVERKELVTKWFDQATTEQKTSQGETSPTETGPQPAAQPD